MLLQPNYCSCTGKLYMITHTTKKSLPIYFISTSRSKFTRKRQKWWYDIEFSNQIDNYDFRFL